MRNYVDEFRKEPGAVGRNVIMADAMLEIGKETDEALTAMGFDHRETAKRADCAHTIARRGGAVRGKRTGQRQTPG